jgi:hypothetical protein
MKTKEQLIEAVMDDILSSVAYGDLTTFEEILGFVPTNNLIQALPEEDWGKYEHLK